MVTSPKISRHCRMIYLSIPAFRDAYSMLNCVQTHRYFRLLAPVLPLVVVWVNAIATNAFVIHVRMVQCVCITEHHTGNIQKIEHSSFMRDKKKEFKNYLIEKPYIYIYNSIPHFQLHLYKRMGRT